VRTTRILICLATPLLLHSQSTANPPAQAAPAVQSSPLSNDRILGIIPNFQTVSDPNRPYAPLRVRDKWWLFVKETVDPYTFVSSAAGAGLSQWHNGAPDYGVGAKAYFQRFGAAQADVTTQNFFSDAVLASILHEDPRYFRMGPSRRVVIRIVYAMSRVAITRKDSGKEGFSYSGLGGMVLGITLSNAYYPPKNVNGGEMESRVMTSLTASALGNLLPEFWPDVKSKLTHLKH
jgi:hypothetical protein